MKTIRIWVYALVKFLDKIVVIKKSRWPFTWLYDLPWWKIEHSEKNIDALKREIYEELWLKEKDYKIIKLLSVAEDFVKHIWQWQEKDEHIIAIVYQIEILKNDFNIKHIDKDWDSEWIHLLSKDEKNIKKTNILEKIIRDYENNN